MDLAGFRTYCPEFVNVPDVLVQGELDSAALEVDVSIWGAMAAQPVASTASYTKADQGHRYLAAHKLASSPFGQQARLVAKDGSTTYIRNYQLLQRQVSSGYRVC